MLCAVKSCLLTTIYKIVRGLNSILSEMKKLNEDYFHQPKLQTCLNELNIPSFTGCIRK